MFMRAADMTFNGYAVAQNQTHVTYFKAQRTLVMDKQAKSHRSAGFTVGIGL